MTFTRTINTLERNLVDSEYPAVIIPDSVATDVLNDSRNVLGEIAYIELFNAGANRAYFAYNRACDDVSSFNGFIAPGQAVSIALRQRVSIFSVGGTIIARTVFKRLDAADYFNQ